MGLNPPPAVRNARLVLFLTVSAVAGCAPFWGARASEPPAMVLGEFSDDYEGRYQVTAQE